METKTFYSGDISQKRSFTEAEPDSKVFVGRDLIYFKGTKKCETKQYASFSDIKTFWDYTNNEELWYNNIHMTIIYKKSIISREKDADYHKITYTDKNNIERTKISKKVETTENEKEVIIREPRKKTRELNKNYYEAIKQGIPCCEYYDIEVENEPLKELLNKYEYEKPIDFVKSYIIEFVRIRNEFMKELPKMNKLKFSAFPKPVESCDIIATESCSSSKLSIHLLFKNNYYINNEELEKVIILFLEYMKTKDTYIKLDKSVYSKNRLFRCILNYKGDNKDRPLRPFNARAYQSLKNNNIEDFFITHIPQAKILGPTPKNDYYRPKYDLMGEPKEEPKVKTENDDTDEQPECKDILGLLKLITDSIKNENHSLCDSEFKNKVCYENYRNISFSWFNSTEDEVILEKGFTHIFELYRHNSNLKEMQQYNNFKRNSGKEEKNYIL